jgi:hypothetical protein
VEGIIQLAVGVTGYRTQVAIAGAAGTGVAALTVACVSQGGMESCAKTLAETKYCVQDMDNANPKMASRANATSFGNQNQSLQDLDPIALASRAAWAPLAPMW